MPELGFSFNVWNDRGGNNDAVTFDATFSVTSPFVRNVLNVGVRPSATTPSFPKYATSSNELGCQTNPTSGAQRHYAFRDPGVAGATLLCFVKPLRPTFKFAVEVSGDVAGKAAFDLPAGLSLGVRRAT